VASISPLEGANFIALSSVYFFDGLGHATTAYGAPARPVMAGTYVSGHNTFLGQLNWLRVFNVLGSDAQATVRAYDYSGSLVAERVLDFGSLRGADLELVSTLGFELSPDTYGIIEIESWQAGAFFSELLRIKPSADGQIIDLAKPLPVR